VILEDFGQSASWNVTEFAVNFPTSPKEAISDVKVAGSYFRVLTGKYIGR
jgi:hypothetical protein